MAYEDAIESLRIVSSCELAGILHVIFEIPELSQSDAGDVDDVTGLRDGGFDVRSVFHGGAEGEHEAREVLVECEQREKFTGNGGVLVSYGRIFGYHVGVLCDSFGVEMRDLKDVKLERLV